MADVLRLIQPCFLKKIDPWFYIDGRENHTLSGNQNVYRTEK